MIAFEKELKKLTDHQIEFKAYLQQTMTDFKKELDNKHQIDITTFNSKVTDNATKIAASIMKTKGLKEYMEIKMGM